VQALRRLDEQLTISTRVKDVDMMIELAMETRSMTILCVSTLFNEASLPSNVSVVEAAYTQAV